MNIYFTSPPRYLFLCASCLALLSHEVKAVTHSKWALSQFQKDLFQEDSAANNSVDLIYFRSKKSTTTTSSSVVKGADIARTPVVPFPLAITGRLAGLQVSQGSGQPLNEGFSFNLRGQAPLVLIDGIPRNLTEIGNDEIESITVLKDAVSTAMLGIRGSGGAIVVTTKKGLENSQQINFTSQFGTQRPTKNLITQPLDSYQYATLYNEALGNDGLSVLSNGFSPQTLAGYQDGSDPFKYPNVNWQDEVLRKSSSYSRYNLNTRGGGKFAKYFVNLEHTNQEGIFKTDEINKYNTNASGKNYFMRSNLDMQINDKLSAGIYIQGRILNRNEPGVRFSSNNIFSALTNTPRGAYPIFNADNSYGGSSLYQNNIVAQSISSGYSVFYNRTVLSDFNIKRTLNEILPGLWVKARASFFSNLGENIVRNKTFATFEHVGSNPTTGAAIYRQYGTTSQTSNTNFVDFQNRSDFQELSFGYSTKFKKNHAFNGLLLANRDNLISGTNITSNLPYTIQGISGHGDYNFKEKYMFEFSFGWNGANRNPPDGKFNYGFFPAVGLGWDISKEEFMQKSVWINQLKLYGSYGKTGRDNGDYFTYIQSFNTTRGITLGSTAGGATGRVETGLANPNTTWEKADKLNIGFKSAFLNESLSFSVEYYSNSLYDLKITRGNNSSLLGIDFPTENIGKERYRGVETELFWSKQTKKLGYSIGINASFQNSKSIFSDEPNLKYDYMERTGKRIGQRFGYTAEGLYQSQADIDNSSKIEGYKPQPGDIKYKDLNDDGLINQFDINAIGTTKPLILTGMQLGLNFKGFNLSAFLQGIFNREIYLSGDSYFAFQNSGRGQAFEHHQNRWTSATAATATYPRLSTGAGPNNGNPNNQAVSSFWLSKGNYVRVKYLEFGYTVPGSITNKIKLKNTRLFINALNPLSFNSKTLKDVDPEEFTGAYPIQKVYTLGLTIQL